MHGSNSITAAFELSSSNVQTATLLGVQAIGPMSFRPQLSFTCGKLPARNQKHSKHNGTTTLGGQIVLKHICSLKHETPNYNNQTHWGKEMLQNRCSRRARMEGKRLSSWSYCGMSTPKNKNVLCCFKDSKPAVGFKRWKRGNSGSLLLQRCKKVGEQIVSV